MCSYLILYIIMYTRTHINMTPDIASFSLSLPLPPSFPLSLPPSLPLSLVSVSYLMSVGQRSLHVCGGGDAEKGGVAVGSSLDTHLTGLPLSPVSYWNQSQRQVPVGVYSYTHSLVLEPEVSVGIILSLSPSLPFSLSSPSSLPFSLSLSPFLSPSLPLSLSPHIAEILLRDDNVMYVLEKKKWMIKI